VIYEDIIGLSILNHRKLKKMSQNELGSVLGISRGLVSAWELGNRTPRGIMLLKIIKYLEINPNELLNQIEKVNKK